MTDPRPVLGDDVLGVVLCGGHSRRMGRDKAQLKMPDDRTFLEHAVARLRSVCARVAVSAAGSRQTAPPLIADPQPSHGPISGLLASLETARRWGLRACLVTPVDTPLLSEHDLQNLLETHRAGPERVTCATAGVQATRIEPLIAVYPIGIAAVLREAVARGDYSPQAVLQTVPVTRVPLSAFACRNVNTPQDLTDLPSPP